LLLRARREFGALIAVLLLAVILVSLSANQDREPAGGPAGASSANTAAPSAARQLESPVAAYRAFRQAQAAQNWGREYECYTPRQQARFSHIVIVTALYLEFQTDLYLQVEAALEHHGLSDNDFEGFWPKNIYEIADAEAPEESPDHFQAEYAARVDRWQREVVPKIRDCGGLIGTLQPIIREGARRLSSTSTVAMTVRQLEGYAYGRMREVKMNGTHATGTIKLKSRFGAFVVPEDLRKAAGDVSRNENATGRLADHANVVLDGYEGLYSWLWEAGAEIYTLAKSMHYPRMVIVGLPTGDVAVGPCESILEDDLDTAGPSEHDEVDINVFERVDNRDESEEVGCANNGTRTVTDLEVQFQLIDGVWRIDSIGCR
jgi:hypothetical protein